MRKTERTAIELLMVATMLFIGVFTLFQPATQISYVQHTVQAGETVWEIAEQYAGKQVKPFNEFVYQIQADNKLAGKFIQPGDVLQIPISHSLR